MPGPAPAARSPLRWTPIATRRRADAEPGVLRAFATGEPAKARLAVELPLLLIVAVVVALVLKAFVAQAFYIPSGSMEPTLEIGDRVVVSRVAYHLHEPRRGDVVVFPSVTEPRPEDHGLLPARLTRELLVGLGLREPAETELIKRVIGLPGETVEGRGGRVLINGQELAEPYLAPDLATEEFPATTVPAGHVFVMGDNRLPRMSQDSRAFGPIPIDSIVGRAVARVWPPGRLAYL
jgi:signal peptidase I